MNIFEKIYLKIIKEENDYRFRKNSQNVNLSVKNDDLVKNLTADDEKTNVELLVDQLANFDFPKVYRSFVNITLWLTDKNGYIMNRFVKLIDNKTIEPNDVNEDSFFYPIYSEHNIDSIKFISYKNNTLKIKVHSDKGASYNLIFKNIDPNISYDELQDKFISSFRTKNNVSLSDFTFGDDLSKNGTQNLIYECGGGRVSSYSCGGGSAAFDDDPTVRIGPDGRTYKWHEANGCGDTSRWIPLPTKEEEAQEMNAREARELAKQQEKEKAEKLIRKIGKFSPGYYISLCFCKKSTVSKLYSILSQAAIDWVKEQIM